jgi:phospholipase/carboxylesterase
MLDAIVIDPPGPVQAAVIWLHGLGADGHDFESIVPELNVPAALGVRFVLPHAPRRPVALNGGFVMRAWYDVLHPDLGQAVDEGGIRESEKAVATLVERELAAGVAPARTILAGFSQGGVIALETAARFPQRLGGAIALSTYVAMPRDFPADARGLPIFMGHGVHDPLIPLSQARKGRELLESKGYAVEWREYPMPHSVCMEEIEDISAWLLARLGA